MAEWHMADGWERRAWRARHTGRARALRRRLAIVPMAAIVLATLLPAGAGAQEATSTSTSTTAPSESTTTSSVPAPGDATTTPPTPTSSTSTTSAPASTPSAVDPAPTDTVGSVPEDGSASSGGINSPAYVGAPWFRPGYPYNQNFPDPTVVWDPVGARYWAYSTSTGGPYLPAMWSTDLATWTARSSYSPNPYSSDPYFNDAFPVPPSWSLGGSARTDKAQWAPGVARIGGQWVAYTSWEVSPGRRCISVATSALPEGPFVDNSTSPLVCDLDPAGSIDPEPFIDADGTPYLLWKATGVPGFWPTTLKSQRLSADGRSFAPGSSPVVLLWTALPWDGNTIENPSMVRYGGTYWLIYSGNEWESADYRMGQARCAGPLGPCARSSASPILGNTATRLGPGGGSMFIDRSGRLRLVHHYWNAPFTSYPADTNCDGGGQCTSQGQRYQRIEGLVASGWMLTADPVGSLDSATASPGLISIAGWALDPSTSQSIQVHVYVDGGFHSLVADGSRPDVGATYPGLGASHGFSTSISVGPGSHVVCAYGISMDSSVNPVLGCATVWVPNASPFGNVESISTGIGRIDVGGWMIDPDTASSTTVRVVVDGVSSTLNADLGRPDIAAAYPQAGAAHGFQSTLLVAPGSHTVCVVGVNVGAGTDTAFPCRTVVVPTGSPFGSLDSLAAATGAISVSGWALDPETSSSIDVVVSLDGVDHTSAASGLRPDVGAAYPGLGSLHGYSQVLAAAPGSHTVCVRAVNVGTPAADTTIGCGTVTVSGQPIGSLDSLVLSGGWMATSGWALDPDTGGPIDVHLLVDGQILAVRASDSRPDVGAAYPLFGASHGFSAAFRPAPGLHTVCAYAINVGLGTNALVGCLRLTVP